ncbi:Myotubularinrelated protein, putative [Acanthamoeba castellanii str. Neff]|uniref:Myotubularinrelated protein, putative n=1 Tax=Acanthamoeba castellanii (strain ATCC 30010 / Neff) TaxID=1257118 RepID=L8H6E8_ACACF|nr:Myotubularinrelated protein, putative [Acanthamoeba castellanii str. Neff]ELR20715.1 Myotubularinrelated protein, putative [Acanthamoeba castellanii str. Neff]
MEGDGSDERILALAEPFLCGGEQPVMHARVVREQAMRTLLSPPSGASSPALGQLVITNFALLFIVERSSTSSSSSSSATKRDVNDLWWNSLDFKVPLGAISRVEAKKDKYVRIHCKDFRLLQFTMPYTLADPTNTKKQMELTMRKIESTLRMFAFSGKLKNLFAFSHTLSTKHCVNGWDRANVRKDLQRMGLPTDKWRISDSNHSYLICPTYPSVFAVPANVSDITLHKVGAFRSKGRIPILSWIHPKNEATITRAAQPLVGIGGSRSTEDEHLIKEIIRATPSSALVIMDARPKVNAAANKARGAGYETMSHYAGEISGMSEDAIAVAEVEGLEGGIGQSGALEFLGIDNIHVMRDSEKKLKDICNHLSVQDKGWFTALDNSRWLDFVSLLLACTRRMVLTIEAGISIFTHCSAVDRADGWDRTSQLSALAMLCLDPFYRTIEGFATLIEREWLAVGHKFQQRYGHGDKHYDDSNRSPIFPQFIDCVHQLLHQFPTCFEFNEEFLVTILDALYSCQYGTFLCDSEKDRQAAQLHSKTVSLWSYTDKHRDRFTSRAYIPYDQVR